MSYISLRAVCKTYPNGFNALNNINLDIPTGEFVVVLGSSGSGKSTLLRTINGLDPASDGVITIDSQIVNKKSNQKIRAQIGMIFQHFNLVDRLNVMTNVLTGRLAKRHWLSSLFYLFPQSDYQIAIEALTEVSLLEKAWSRADTLSGGQQQRVGIARALAQQPNIILADEPVASLDPKSSEEVLKLLKKICVEKGITVIVNLHQVDFAMQNADRIVALKSGQLIFDGKPSLMDTITMNEIYNLAQEEVENDSKLAMADA